MCSAITPWLLTNRTGCQMCSATAPWLRTNRNTRQMCSATALWLRTNRTGRQVCSARAPWLLTNRTGRQMCYATAPWLRTKSDWTSFVFCDSSLAAHKIGLDVKCVMRQLLGCVQNRTGRHLCSATAPWLRIKCCDFILICKTSHSCC